MGKLKLGNTKPENSNIKSTYGSKKYFLVGFVASTTVFVVFLSLIVIGYLFDIADFKGVAIEKIGIEIEQQRRLEDRKKEIDSILIDIDEKMIEIKDEKAMLISREIEILEREEDLVRRENLLNNKKIETDNVISIFVEMDSQIAANILAVDYQKEEVAIIIKNLPEKKAAEILSHMTAEIAAKILNAAS